MSLRATRGQVSGRTVEVAIEGVMSVFRQQMWELFEENGIEEPDPEPDAWYELQAFLSVLEAIERDTDENALTEVGQATPAHIDWPGDPETPHEALARVTDVYETHHQQTTGHYDYERRGDTAARLTVTAPYPCAFNRGLITGTAEAFGANDARIAHVSTCQHDGGERCVYEVFW